MIYIQSELINEPEGLAFKNHKFQIFYKKQAIRKYIDFTNAKCVVAEHDVIKPKKILSCYPKVLNDFYHRSILEKFSFDISLPIFIKPQKHKEFESQIVMEESQLLKYKNKKVYVSNVVEFLSEYRIYICQSIVLGKCLYSGDINYDIDMNIVQICIDKMKEEGYLTYALDVGVLKDNLLTAVIEVNPPYSIGLYDGMLEENYITFLLNGWEEYFNI